MDIIPALLTPAGITRMFLANTYAWTNEADMERALQDLIEHAGGTATAQVRLTPQDRIDLVATLPECRLGIEIKVKGDAGAVRSQLSRYANSDQLDELMIVTTQRRHLINLPNIMARKPLHRVLVRTW